MIHSDKPAFIELFNGLAEYYKKDKLSKMALQLTFGALEEFSIAQLIKAATAHIKTPGNGRFMPGAADLILHLEGGTITTGQIIAAAKLAQTPFGIMARIHIGGHDLTNLNSFDLKQRAEEVLQLLPKWKQQANAGGYSQHQISIMIKYGVDPTAPFYSGLAAPINKDMLIDRIDHIKGTQRHKELLEPPHTEQATASTGTQVAEIARGIGRLESDK